MKDIFYENASGKKIDLLSGAYALQTGTLFDHAWEYVSNGIQISGFNSVLMEKELTLTVQDPDFEGNMDRFLEYTESDILQGTPGKLWYGDSYLQCFLYAGELMEWEYDAGYADKLITLVTAYPFWIRETSYTFRAEEVYSGNNKRYPYRYPHRYANGLTGSYIINPHFNTARFKMIIYGPVVNPLVIIGGNQYRANTLLEPGEYLEIDGIAGTVKKVMNSGEIVNAFHARAKEPDIFEPILPGRQPVEWTGKFDFDLILYEERSEPLWQ